MAKQAFFRFTDDTELYDRNYNITYYTLPN